MAVEIVILSGARRGTRLVLDCREFRLGTSPDCELFFDPRQDPSAADCAASLYLEGDHWHIRSLGPRELIVNQQSVTESTLLRSGDIVRLSPTGPDFSFRLLASTAETQPLPNALEPPPGSSPTTPAQPVNPTPGETNPPPPPRSTRTPQARWILVGLAAGLMATVLWHVLSPSPAPPATPAHEAEETLRPDINPGQGAQAEPPPHTKPAPPIAPASSPAPPAEPVAAPPTVAQPAPPSPDPQPQLRDTVFLVTIEQSGRFWPFAGSVAVGKQTLLTSAREAMLAAAWRQNDGFKLWIVNLTLGIKKPIRDIRLHGVFATLADKPNDWIYYDLALLCVDDDLPKIAPIASSEQLAALKEEAAVVCLAFPHEGKKTSMVPELQPKQFRGSIFMMTAGQKLPGQPRLLHIKADLPPNLFGSPIFDDQGRVIGIYGSPVLSAERSAVPGGATLTDIHFAPLVVPEAIRLWTEKRDEKLWVSPQSLKAFTAPSSDHSARIQPPSSKEP